MYLKKAIRGTIIVLALSLMSGLFGYLLRVVLARKLSVADFGLFYSVLTLFFFISYFVDAGMSQTVSRFIIGLRVGSEKSKRRYTAIDVIFNALTLQMIISVTIVVLMNVLANFLSVHYFHNNVNLLIFILGLWLISLPFLSSYSGIFYGFHKPETYMFVETLRTVSLLLVTILFLSLGYTVIAPAIGYALTNVLLIPMLFLFINKRFIKMPFFRMKLDKSLIHKITSFSIMVTIVNFVWFIITQTDTLMLTYFTDSSVVGLYQIAVSVSALLFYLANSMSIVIFPMASEFSLKRDKAKLIQGLNLIYKYLFIVVVPLVILLFSFPDMVISLLFTAKYLGAVNALRILVVSAIFFSMTMINGSILTAMNRPKDIVKSMIAAAVLNIILNLILIPRYGMMGAAVATLVSFIVATIISSYNLSRHLSISYPVKTWIALGVLGVFFIELLSYLRSNIVLPFLEELVVILFIFFVSYILILLALRVIRISEIKEIVNVVMK